MSELNLDQCLERVRRDNPLTLSITNQVTISECANGLLAIGASPVMSDDSDDAEALAGLAAATVLNIGTVGERQFQVMLAAGRGARKGMHPIVFDPVGVGATLARRKYSSQLISQLSPDIIRGNFSEIRALAGLTFEQKGVDSADAENTANVAAIAEALSNQLRCVVAVTGATDVVTGDGRTFFIDGGSPLLTKVTGTGCLLSALVGAYAGANQDDLVAGTAAAMAHMAVAGGRAAGELNHQNCLGSFRVGLFDHLARITGADLSRAAEVRAK